MPISKGQPFGGGAGVPDAASLFLNPAFWKMLQSLSGSTALPGTQKGGGPALYPQKPDPPVGVNLAGGATPVLSDVTNPVAMGTGGLQVGRDNSLDPFGGNWTEGFGAKPGSPWVNKPVPLWRQRRISDLYRKPESMPPAKF